MNINNLTAKGRIKLSNPLHLLATCFGSSILMNWMPGTAGSLVAIPLWFVLHTLLSWPLDLFVIIFSWIIGIYVCHKTACDISIHDHSYIVWDELVGMWIILITLPHYTITLIALSFILFRFLDIWKPWPIRWCHDQVQGGIGIMLDDVIASIITTMILHISGLCSAIS
ncbi:phosphatidylglycerophosphatase A family protein [Candidatus Palibaumannia cicadellinicola]|uniref:Phosphatidylglycerophosphatase A n=1 Tax=Baumannia cicadellinicola subsp. Homalodisca coagulata TaxID=374463 RepID=Q1LSN2_BAUCH|nr:phosphatidylglycerophosphatase A [Candidatus Baumannia cicadellinicola]ABF14270.1 phosphatidylglycerophosphatase [Baumannia cicadellinicola str. Hc (Homalodisca coagulata)]MBS0032531.1 phosphatidylglycerophosphatase A [Candidatus Baumannia cicadellinicola]MCJ7461947.1 phosphatidylglycerophosphatase A [Candidatus Baumannia cicadellinicola]MCJ7462537.1 phosphatidylglycerophosphatase A [Candidatus Baumannia cicadellinicola]